MKSEISLVTVKKFLMKKKFTATSMYNICMQSYANIHIKPAFKKRICITNEKKCLCHVT